jgi:hypothetical protein
LREKGHFIGIETIVVYADLIDEAVPGTSWLFGVLADVYRLVINTYPS